MVLQPCLIFPPIKCYDTLRSPTKRNSSKFQFQWNCHWYIASLTRVIKTCPYEVLVLQKTLPRLRNFHLTSRYTTRNIPNMLKLCFHQWSTFWPNYCMLIDLFLWVSWHWYQGCRFHSFIVTHFCMWCFAQIIDFFQLFTQRSAQSMPESIKKHSPFSHHRDNSLHEKWPIRMQSFCTWVMRENGWMLMRTQSWHALCYCVLLWFFKVRILCWY